MNKNPSDQLCRVQKSNKTEENPLQNKGKLCKKNKSRPFAQKKAMQKTQTKPLVKNIFCKTKQNTLRKNPNHWQETKTNSFAKRKNLAKKKKSHMQKTKQKTTL